MLEAGLYGDNAFITLTYDDEHDPTSLEPKHAQTFLKRLRHNYPKPIRYDLVGEYGESTDRPHYHAALFNFPACQNGNSRYSRTAGLRCCQPCHTLRDTWGMGHTFNGQLEPRSAAYIAGYVTKKMTRTDDRRLGNRHPEFARMSLRPGIGADAMHELASVVLTYEEAFPEDAPNALSHGRRQLPLGRYLTRKARILSGRPPEAPESTIAKVDAELQDVREAARQASQIPNVREYSTSAFRKAYEEKYKGKHAQIEAREKIWKTKGIM